MTYLGPLLQASQSCRKEREGLREGRRKERGTQKGEKTKTETKTQANTEYKFIMGSSPVQPPDENAAIGTPEFKQTSTSNDNAVPWGSHRSSHKGSHEGLRGTGSPAITYHIREEGTPQLGSGARAGPTKQNMGEYSNI